jgi:uncharacterized SAM-binding protein YcdF (DUF218 family)
MFFYLSQFLSFLAMPLTIILVFLIMGFLWKNRVLGRKLQLLGLILLLLFSNQFLSNLAMHLWEDEIKPISTLPEYEIGIVLTGVTNLSKTVYDRTLFNKGADRATHAVQLYKMGKIQKILISGGQGLNPTNPNTEAELLRDFMLIAGINPEDILLEKEAKNTRQNALLTKELLFELDAQAKEKEYLLITSAFHMKRSKACFDKVGLNVYTFPVDYYAEDIRFSIPNLLFPSPQSIFLWHKLFKEWIGLVSYKVAGYI